jgi:hypothetical protein
MAWARLGAVTRSPCAGGCGDQRQGAGGAGTAQDPAGFLDLGALGGVHLGELAVHRLGHGGERVDLGGEAGQHVTGGIHRPGGFPVGTQPGDVLFEGRQVGGVGR